MVVALGSEALGVQREDRQHDAEPDEVERDSRPDRAEPGGVAACARAGARALPHGRRHERCRSRCLPRPSRRLELVRGSRRRGRSPSRPGPRRARRPEPRPSAGTSADVGLAARGRPRSQIAEHGARDGAAAASVTRVERGVHLAHAVEQQGHRRRRVEVVVHARRGTRSSASASGTAAPAARRRRGGRTRRAAASDRSASVGRVLADLDRRAVVGLQHEQPVGARVDRLDEVEQVREVAERLRHLLAARPRRSRCAPSARRTRWPERDGLGPLVLVVREREVLAAAVEVEPVAEQVERHHDALGVPARAGPSPHGDCHDGSPGLAFFQSTKSTGDALLLADDARPAPPARSDCRATGARAARSPRPSRPAKYTPSLGLVGACPRRRARRRARPSRSTYAVACGSTVGRLTPIASIASYQTASHSTAISSGRPALALGRGR